MMHLRIFLSAAALALAAPLSAADDLTDRLDVLNSEISEAYGLGYDNKDEINERLLKVAVEAEALLSEAPQDLDEATRISLLRVIGEAYFGAAQHYDTEWGSEEELIERRWLIKVEAALRPVMEALGHEDGPAYDYRGATGQLWNHARNNDLPEMVEWSALRVQGNRYMHARRPDDDFEREFLAQSLYEHGWLTSDDALIAEADAIFDSFPEDDKPYSLVSRRRKMAEGEAPY